MKANKISHNSRTLRQQEKESYPNTNIFQNEKDYKMKPNLSFSENEEANCQKVLFMRHVKIIYIMSIYFCIRFLVDFFQWNIYSVFFMLLRIPVFIISIFCHLFILRINRFISNMFSIRILFEVCAIFVIISNCISDFNEREEIFFSFEIFFSIFVVGIILNYGFVLDIKTSMIFHLIEGVSLLSSHGHKDTFFVKRLVLNFFSKKLIITIGYILCALWFQYITSKPLRELWALYDSFKKSYFSLKSILEDSQYPILIVKKDFSVIYYKNKEVDKFYQRLKGQKAKTEITFIDMLNLFNPKICKLFKNEVEKSKNNFCHSFVFPYAKSFQFKESPFFPTLYRIDPNNSENANSKLLHFSVHDFLWKGESESYYCQISENPVRFSTQIVLLDNLHIINEEGSKFVSNLNHICLNAPEYNPSNRIELSKLTTITEKGQTKERTSPYMPRNKIKIPTAQKLTISQSSILYKRKLDSSRKRLSLPSLINPQVSPIYSQLLNELNNSKKEMLSSLYPFLFYIKLNINYLSDLLLTSYVFDSMIYNKYTDTHRFQFDSFLHYMVNYLSPFAKINNFKIVVKNDLNEEIEANYYCIRVLIFNIMMFIFNNSRDMKEKTLEIRIEHVRFGKQNGCYYRLNFSFNESSSYFSYETLGDFFDTFDIARFCNYDMLKMNNVIDFGLLVAGLVGSKVFLIEGDNQKSFVIGSNPKKISAIIYVLEKTDLQRSSTIKHFKSIDSNISEIERRAMEKIASVHYRSVIEEKSRSLENQCQTQRRNSIDERYDNGKEDEYLIAEESIISLEKDVAFAHDYKMKSLVFHNEITDKYYFPCNATEIQPKKVIVDQLNIIPKTKRMKSYSRVTIEQHTYSFCKTPRFLIVEDNIIGRIGVVEKLKEIKFKFLFDVAVDGDIAIEKYKSLLNTGYLFDFIFMDIGLININGLEATKEIRAIERKMGIHTNIICVSVDAKSIYETQSVSTEEINGNLFDNYCKSFR